MIQPEKNIPLKEQCKILDVPRSSYYYRSKGESEENIELMKQIDIIHTEHITWGSRKIRDYLRNTGILVNRKRIQRLMNLMEIQVLFPKVNTSKQNLKNRTYPYLLRNLQINRSNQVWCSDVTYIRLKKGFVYLVGIMDWYSKKILSWEISITADKYFCISSLETALRKHGRPEIFNSDQGSQYTSEEFLKVLKDEDIKISMNGKGRALDNIAIERFWRTLKYDEVYLQEYESVQDARNKIGKFIQEYNTLRPHSTLGGSTPDKVYYSGLEKAESA